MPEEHFSSQGDQADSVFILQKGRAKLTVVSEAGKIATIILLAQQDFVGEEALASIAGLCPATAVTGCTPLKIMRDEMIRAMDEEHTRSVISFFMNRFRKMGFIEYNGRIRVHKSLLNVILHDQFSEDNVRVPKWLTELALALGL